MTAGYTIMEAPFVSGWEALFYSINREWLIDFFTVTAADEEQLKNPDRIMDNGGAVLFVLQGEVVVGTAALVVQADGSVELAKMGVLKKFRGQGAGRALIQSALERARQLTDGVIFLETVESLSAAIHLYEDAGFIRTGALHTHPKFGRTTFRMELQR